MMSLNIKVSQLSDSESDRDSQLMDHLCQAGDSEGSVPP
jgi:hypothetical protein